MPAAATGLDFRTQLPTPRGRGHRAMKRTSRYKAHEENIAKNQEAARKRAETIERRHELEQETYSQPQTRPSAPRTGLAPAALPPSASVVVNPVPPLSPTQASYSTTANSDRVLNPFASNAEDPARAASGGFTAAAASYPFTFHTPHHDTTSYAQDHFWSQPSTMQAAFDAAHYAATDHHDPQDAFDDTGRVPLDDEEGMFEARAREDVSSLAQPALAPPVVSVNLSGRARLQSVNHSRLPQGTGVLPPRQSNSQASVSNGPHIHDSAPTSNTRAGHRERESTRTAEAAVDTPICSRRRHRAQDDSEELRLADANPLSDSESDVDDDEARPRKKSRHKITRLGQIADPVERRVTGESFPFMRADVITGQGFPDPSSPTAIYGMCCKAYERAFNELLETDPEFVEGYDPIPSRDSLALLEDRIAQTRGEVKDLVCKHLTREFSFRACPEDNTAAVSHNRDLVNVLVGAELQRDHTYFYEDYRHPTTENTVYKNKLVSLSINELYYKDQDSIGVAYGEFFGNEDSGIPLPVIALVVTAVRYAIDEWQTGVRRGGRRGIKFRWKRYHHVYKFHMEQLTTWSTTYARSGTCLAYQKILFASAREHAGVTISTADENPEVEEQGLDTSVFGAV